MATEPALPFPDDRVFYERISRLIAATVVRMQQTAPEYLQPKFKAINLAEKQGQLVAKLTGLLSPHTDLESLKRLLAGALQQMLTPQFFETTTYRELLRQIGGLMADSTEPGRLRLTQSVRPQAETGVDAEPLAIAILLLDAENIQLPESAEAWITQLCQYPLQTKIAFGDWRKLGNRDQVLHQRGYQMIHVPPGKNGADLKMTALGASMLVLAPKVKEVVICSSDNDLEHLKQVLFNQGLRVCQVRRQDNKLTLVNGKFQTSEFPLPPPIEVPELPEGLQFLRTYITNSPEAPIPFNQLAVAFYQRFKVSLRQFAHQHGFKQTPKAFLENQSGFLLAVHEDKKLYASLVALSALPQSPQQEAKDFTPKTLEIVIKGILKKLSQEQSTGKVPISLIAYQFRQQHGRSIKSVLKQYKLGQNLPRFFKTLKGVVVEWDEQQKHWLVSLGS